VKPNRLLSMLRAEWLLVLALATALAFLLPGEALFGGLDRPSWLVLIFIWLFAIVLGSALAVVRHADHLADRLREPYGTLILTLAITSIEVVSISAIMLHGQNNPTLARDTLFAVAMIVLNGVVGLSLLLGGWRRLEQHYNLQGANAYLGMIIPLGVLALVLPDFTTTTPGPTLAFAQELFIAVSSFGLYLAFLFLQTNRHRSYFLAVEDASAAAAEKHAPVQPAAVLRHVALLLAYMIPIVFLAEKLAVPVDFVIEDLHAPGALGGLTMAILVATPEAIGAVRAARANQLQRSVNISLGSVLSTIGLTVPSILVVSHLTHLPITLGLQHTSLLLFLLTLTLCLVTFSSGRTTVLQGGVHLILFAAYLFFVVQP
jgi:Ca2+:H+ antiporter